MKYEIRIFFLKKSLLNSINYHSEPDFVKNYLKYFANHMKMDILQNLPNWAIFCNLEAYHHVILIEINMTIIYIPIRPSRRDSEADEINEAEED